MNDVRSDDIDGDDWWQQAASRVLADADAEVRDEAAEVFLAEAARCRLVDRRGPARVTLRCGTVHEGHLVGASAPADHLDLRTSDGAQLLIAVASVLAVEGSRSALREESSGREMTVGSWLRECWQAGDVLAAGDAAGRWHAGTVVSVGSDHVELQTGDRRVVLPFAAVDVWRR